MAEIKIMDHGPYRVKGEFELLDGAGNKLETKQQISLCRCGFSKDKPFCDGSHKAEGFQNEVRA